MDPFDQERMRELEIKHLIEKYKGLLDAEEIVQIYQEVFEEFNGVKVQKYVLILVKRETEKRISERIRAREKKPE